MRLGASWLLLLLGLATPALSQPAAQRGTPAPAADPVVASYAALPEPERISIQNDLIWTGD